jgi:hypothetical protein
MKAFLGKIHPHNAGHSPPGEPCAVQGVFVAAPTEPSVQTRKSSGLASPSGLLRLFGHAAMGVAMGLAFALMLILIDPPGIAGLIARTGSQGTAVFVGSLVLTFGIGATLTGAVFIVTEDS